MTNQCFFLRSLFMFPKFNFSLDLSCSWKKKFLENLENSEKIQNLAFFQLKFHQ